MSKLQFDSYRSPRIPPGSPEDHRPRALILLWKAFGVMVILSLVGVLGGIGLCVSGRYQDESLFGVASLVISVSAAVALAIAAVAAPWEFIWNQRTRRAGRPQLLMLLREGDGTADIPTALAATGLDIRQLSDLVHRLRREGLVDLRVQLREEGENRQVIVLMPEGRK